MDREQNPCSSTVRKTVERSCLARASSRRQPLAVGLSDVRESRGDGVATDPVSVLGGLLGVRRRMPTMHPSGPGRLIIALGIIHQSGTVNVRILSYHAANPSLFPYH